MNHRRHSLPVIRRGVTLIECVVAAAFLSVAVVGVMSSTQNTVRNIGQTKERMEAVRLAERLIEEIAAKPQAMGPGPRSGWAIPHYDGFAEAPGEIRESDGELARTEEQHFARSVSVAACLLPDPATGLNDQNAWRVTVAVDSPDEWRIELVRYIPSAGAHP